MDIKNNLSGKKFSLRSRRDFIKNVVAISVGGFALVPMLSGCATELALYSGEIENGTVTLYLSQYPELLFDGEAIMIELEQIHKSIVVVRIRQDMYSSFSPLCPKDSCTVNKDGMEFLCPCDGSRYSLQGTLLKGSSEASLKRYATEYDGDLLRISLV